MPAHTYKAYLSTTTQFECRTDTVTPGTRAHQTPLLSNAGSTGRTDWRHSEIETFALENNKIRAWDISKTILNVNTIFYWKKKNREAGSTQTTPLQIGASIAWSELWSRDQTSDRVSRQKWIWKREVACNFEISISVISYLTALRYFISNCSPCRSLFRL